MPSKAQAAFDKNLTDIEALLKLHTEKGGNAAGRRYGLEVLNKSAIVLITSFWEAYCEDIAAEALEHIVVHAATADALPKEIKKNIADKLKADKNELAVWSISDDKWRAVLKANMEELRKSRDRRLNTPKRQNIDELFESAIGLTGVSKAWVWAKRLPAKKAGEKLDKFVELRGAIAHRGKAQTSVTKAQVIAYRDFVKNAARVTGEAINDHVQRVTGHALF